MSEENRRASPSTEGEGDRISDARLASLAAAYGKMSFEKTFGDMASAFRELIEARALLSAPDARREALEEAADIARAHRDKSPEYGTPMRIWQRACAQIEDVIRARALKETKP